MNQLIYEDGCVDNGERLHAFTYFRAIGCCHGGGAQVVQLWFLTFTLHSLIPIILSASLLDNLMGRPSF